MQLQILKNVCSLLFKVNNVCSPAENLPLLQGCFECFSLLAFDEGAEKSQLFQFFFRAYLHCDRLENDPEVAMQNAEAQALVAILEKSQLGSDEMGKIGLVCERILSFGISFMFSLLEDPNVWRSDFAFEDAAG